MNILSYGVYTLVFKTTVARRLWLFFRLTASMANDMKNTQVYQHEFFVLASVVFMITRLNLLSSSGAQIGGSDQNDQCSILGKLSFFSFLLFLL